MNCLLMVDTKIGFNEIISMWCGCVFSLKLYKQIIFNLLFDQTVVLKSNTLNNIALHVSFIPEKNFRQKSAVMKFSKV